MTMGFLLHTNVLSELMRENPATEVMSWLDAQAESLLHTSTVTQAEVLTGIAFLPKGKRRDALASSADQKRTQSRDIETAKRLASEWSNGEVKNE